MPTFVAMSSTLLSSSSTTLLGPSPTTGPSLLMWSLSCMPMPWKPVSDAPTESVKTLFGNAAIQRSLTGGLKIAALLEIANRLDPSYGVPVAALRSNSSISGRAIASPVMKISWTLSPSMISQVRSGSNFGSRIVRWPANRCISRPAWAPPCISGLSGNVTIRGSLACLDWSNSSSGSPV